MPPRPRSLSIVLLLLAVAPNATADKAWLGQSIWLAPDVYRPVKSTKTAPERAADLYRDATDATAEGRSSDAFELATRSALFDPTYAPPRRVLGYELVDGEWLTPFQSKQRKRGYRWDTRYGWLRAEEVARYEAGERRVGRRWLDTAADAKRHAEITNGWQVRTDHFVVTTNHSLAEGARLAAELEALFQVWRQWFAGYWLPDREVQALFAGDRDARETRRQMKVFYHRDKAGYVEHLRRRQPRIAETLGIYFDDRREAHFYCDSTADAELMRATLYHEAAHQLFAENGPGRVGAGRHANFWLIEGAACYFELLAPVAGEPRFTFGNPAQGRLPSAVAEGPVMPLADLAALGRTDLQRLDRLPSVYAQATGVVAMLRHGARESDREALTGALRSVYGGRPDGEELARQTGRSMADLDRDYQEFLENLSR